MQIKLVRKTVDILGIPVDSLTMDEAVGLIRKFLGEDRVHSVFTPNAEIIMAAQRDPALKEILQSSDMVVADGAGVVLASRLLKRGVPEKVSGVDLVRECFKAFSGESAGFFLFGGKAGVAEKAAENIQRDYPGTTVSGCMHGYFTQEDEDAVIGRINDSRADILLVALGAPKQEKWIAKNRERLKAKVCMGVGGSLDILAGTVALAPEFFRRNGLEWLFRLYKQPSRARRMLDLPRFMIRVIGARFSGK